MADDPLDEDFDDFAAERKQRRAEQREDRAERKQREAAAEQRREAAEAQRKSEKAAATRNKLLKALAPTGTERFTKRLITLIELGAVGLLVYVLRKPLEHFAGRVAADIYKGLHVIKDGLKDGFTDVEKAETDIRAYVRDTWLRDPILMHKLGPGLYRELILNAAWDTTIHSPDGSYPGRVADLFVAGTGRGAFQLRGSIVYGVSIQILALIQWFIGNSADLQSVGRFPLVAGQ